jgi:hypothetical protein
MIFVPCSLLSSLGLAKTNRTTPNLLSGMLLLKYLVKYPGHVWTVEKKNIFCIAYIARPGFGGYGCRRIYFKKIENLLFHIFTIKIKLCMHVHITLILIHVNTQMQNTIVSSLDKKDKMAIYFFEEYEFNHYCYSHILSFSCRPHITICFLKNLYK